MKLSRISLVVFFLLSIPLSTQCQTIYDPHLSYLGSLSDDVVNTLLLQADDLLLCGTTYSSDSIPFPPGPTYSLDQNDSMVVNGVRDIFITRMSEDIEHVHRSIFLGGTGDDRLSASVLYMDSLLYLVGVTDSEDLPVTENAYQTEYSGGDDLFIMALDLTTDSDSLLYCTYLGGSDDESAADLLCDSIGNVYILASTRSTDIQVDEESEDMTELGGEGDVLLVALDGQLSTPFLIRRFGSPETDIASDLSLNADTMLYILANSNASTGLVMDSLSLLSSGFNAHLLMYDLMESTFTKEVILGGAGLDLGHSTLLFDSTLLVSGTTTSTDLIMTDNAQFPSFEETDGQQAVIFQFSLALDSVHYSTFIGGTEAESGMELSLNNGYPHLLGQTASIDFPTLGDAYQIWPSQGGDLFLCRFDTSLVLNGSTYFGTHNDDHLIAPISGMDGTALTFNTLSEMGISGDHFIHREDISYLAMHLESQDTLYAPGGLDFLPNAEKDIFLTHFYDMENGPCGTPCTDCICTGGSSGGGGGNASDNHIHLCEGQSFFLHAHTNMLFAQYQWYAGNGWGHWELEDDDIYSGTQTDSLHLLDVSTEMEELIYRCNVSNTFKFIWYTPKRIKVHPVPDNPGHGLDTVVICIGDTALIQLPEELSYSWQTGSDSASTAIIPTGPDSIWVVGASEYCLSDTAAVHVDVHPPFGPLELSSSTSEICAMDSLLLEASGADSYQWSTGHSDPSIVLSPPFSQTVHLTALDEHLCKLNDSIALTVNALPLLSAMIGNETCEQNDDGWIDLEVSAITGYSVIWSNDSTDEDLQGLSEGIYSAFVLDDNGCSAQGEYVVVNDSTDCEYDFFLPSIFSPNADGVNDVFAAQGKEIDYYVLSIFDQEGRKVFITSMDGEGWDGKSEGRDCPAGVYYYHVYGSFTDGMEFELTEDLTLLR